MCATREQCAAKLCRCAGALLLLAALAAASAEREAQLAPAPFILGSRFGRSQPRLVAPRNDKFFLSSRYGKRSESAGLPPLPPPVAPPLFTPAPPELLCDYTGVAALYRCRAQRRYHDNMRLWDETTSEDE